MRFIPIGVALVAFSDVFILGVVSAVSSCAGVIAGLRIGARVMHGPIQEAMHMISEQDAKTLLKTAERSHYAQSIHES